MAPTSFFLSVEFISAPVAAVVFADLEIEIRQIRQYGDDDAHQLQSVWWNQVHFILSPRKAKQLRSDVFGLVTTAE